MADLGEDFLFYDIFQLDTRWQCPKDLSMACTLCRAHSVINIRYHILVPILVDGTIGRRKEKSTGGSGQECGGDFVFEAELAEFFLFC